MTKPKLCKDCVRYYRVEGDDLCNQKRHHTDLVRGNWTEFIPYLASNERTSIGACGEAANNYKRKWWKFFRPK